MNNRYIFKGKRKDNGEWVCGYYVFQRKRSGVFGQVIAEVDHDRHLIIDLRGHSYEVIPETVGQCTGLKDKNGKWIFENDIVTMPAYRGGRTKSVVYFKNGKFAVDGSNYAFKDICPKNMEVIGNIYDNKELLEAER